MIAEVNGISLCFEKRGTGRPLVMLHGNGEDHTIFDEAAEALKDAFCCYLVDSRCHGQSTDTLQLHYSDMADDVVALIEKLGLDDVALYGFSDGGIVALMAAQKCGRITELVVSGANLRPNGVKFPLWISIRLEYLLKRDKKMLLMIREPDIDPASLAGIKAKTLVLAGSGDLITLRETRRIAASIPGAELSIVRGEDHGSYIVHSSKIADILLDFLSSGRGKEK